MKPILSDPDCPQFSQTLATLQKVMITGLTLLHPVMPFITEDLYHKLPLLDGETRAESLMIADYPAVEKVNVLEQIWLIGCSKKLFFSGIISR